MTATKHYLMALVFTLVPFCAPILAQDTPRQHYPLASPHQAPAHPRTGTPATRQAPIHRRHS